MAWKKCSKLLLLIEGGLSSKSLNLQQSTHGPTEFLEEPLLLEMILLMTSLLTLHILLLVIHLFFLQCLLEVEITRLAGLVTQVHLTVVIMIL
jgi:hypothetical protein